MIMRRIRTKKQETKRQKRNQGILVFIIVLILLGSTFGIIVNSFGNSGSDSDTKIKYNGYEFLYQNGYWIYDAGNYQLGFLYNPEETENLSIQEDVIVNIYSDINSYQNVPVYIYSEDSGAEIEIYRNIYPFAERIQNACPEGKECDEDVPVKDCSNRFIIIEKSDDNEIVQEENCVYVRGKEENLIKLSDELLYNIFGIK